MANRAFAAFHFDGIVPASKSEINRALIAASYAEDFLARHDLGAELSAADDVRYLRAGIAAILGGITDIDCGEAAAVFRFLVMRASRRPGFYRLTGSRRLLERPHDELIAILEKLGVRARWERDFTGIITALALESAQGWREPASPVVVSVLRSSQFASALLLNAWDLPWDLSFTLEGEWSSEPYFKMSEVLASRAGMSLSGTSSGGRSVPARSRVTLTRFEPEGDWSSAFALGALAAVAGQARMRGLRRESLQPDASGIDLLRRMGASADWEASESGGPYVIVRRGAQLRGLEADLRHRPDLFPVLAGLAALAESPSRFVGLGNLAHKESDRLARMSELFTALGVLHTRGADWMEISGRPAHFNELEYDPRPDHRLAMAALVLRAGGAPLRVLHMDVLDKSFPELRNWVTTT